MSRFWSAVTHQLTPYVPGEQPQHQRLIKLNTNESPFDPAPGVMQAIAETPTELLRRYPDPESVVLRSAIAKRMGLAVDQVFVGNGSDEVLGHIFQGLLNHSLPLLLPEISYSFYPVWASLYGIDIEPLALAEDFSINVEDYARPNGGIILPNPNAPTGILLPLADIRRLLDMNADSVVVIDEAYIDFGGQSAAALVPEYDNLLVVHTLSKSRSLAGLRVGYALGQAPLIEGLNRVKNSFNSYPLDVLAQRGALASIEDEAWFQQCCEQLIANREMLRGQLQERGFEVLPSSANFLFARHPERSALTTFNGLREQGVIVRHFNTPPIDQFLRISVGSHDDCLALLEALDSL